MDLNSWMKTQLFFLENDKTIPTQGRQSNMTLTPTNLVELVFIAIMGWRFSQPDEIRLGWKIP